MSACPDADTLRNLLTGRLGDGEQEELIAHVDSCLSCQQTMERLAEGSTWAAVKQLQQADAASLPEGLRSLRERAPTLQAPSGADVEEAAPIVFPGAATKHGPLGRLQRDASNPLLLFALARGAVATGSPSPRRRLLPALAVLAHRRGTALDHRTLAALRLQAGAPQAALDSLRTALARRRTASLPLEELLLALILHRIGQREQARREFERVRTWRRQVPPALQAAALTGVSGAGPLVGLTFAVAPVGDSRFDKGDAFTRVEFELLLAQVERSLLE